MSKDTKLIRGQVRQIAGELFTAELKVLLVAAVQKEIDAKTTAKLNTIDAHLRATLKGIDDRFKELQSFILRTSAPKAPVKE